MQPAPWKTRILAVAGVSRPYRLHPKASDWRPHWKESDFPEWLQSHTRYGDADISNARINTRTAIWRTLLPATGSNIAFKIAAKSLQIETWLLLKAYRKSLPPYSTILSPTSTTCRLATIHGLQTDRWHIVPKARPNGWRKTEAVKLCRFARKSGNINLSSYFNANACLFVLHFYLFLATSKEKYIFWGGMDALALLYFIKI